MSTLFALLYTFRVLFAIAKQTLTKPDELFVDHLIQYFTPNIRALTTFFTLAKILFVGSIWPFIMFYPLWQFCCWSAVFARYTIIFNLTRNCIVFSASICLSELNYIIRKKNLSHHSSIFRLLFIDCICCSCSFRGNEHFLFWGSRRFKWK